MVRVWVPLQGFYRGRDAEGLGCRGLSHVKPLDTGLSKGVVAYMRTCRTAYEYARAYTSIRAYIYIYVRIYIYMINIYIYIGTDQIYPDLGCRSLSRM